MKIIRTIITAVILITVSLLILCSCNNSTDSETTTIAPVEMSSMSELGQGEKTFIFQIHDIDGHITPFVIKTNKKIVGEALQELGIIKGEEGDFGLYVKEVNGIIADYSTTGTYWAFYIGDEYAAKGIDMTEISDGKTYSLRIEK